MLNSKFAVETFTGQFVDCNDPDPATICIMDVAHALSQICRFGGHCSYHYSVAEHAVYVSKRLERQGFGRQQQLNGLHHDDAEAYLGDIPRPIKPLLGETYAQLTNEMDAAIAKALAVPIGAYGVEHKARTKDADNWILMVEARNLMSSQGRSWMSGEHPQHWDMEGLPSRIIPPDYWRGGGVSPTEARAMFIERHNELTA